MRNYLTFLLVFCAFTALAEEQPRERIARENAQAIVAINVLKEDGSTFTGTGFVLTPDGLIATSRHVTADATYSNVTFSNGAISGEAQTLAQAANVDLALLKIDAQNLSTVTVTTSADVRPGQEITVIGNPRRLQNTVSSGLISQVRKKADGTIWHQISAPISPSSSGSPVFNQDGHVISVAFASYPGENNQNLNFAVPSDYLLSLVRMAGFELPNSPNIQVTNPTDTEGNAFARHCKKSWEMLKRLFNQHRTKDPTPSRA